MNFFQFNWTYLSAKQEIKMNKWKETNHFDFGDNN